MAKGTCEHSVKIKDKTASFEGCELEVTHVIYHSHLIGQYDLTQLQGRLGNIVSVWESHPS